MKLVIDIPKDEYNEIMKDDYIPDGNFRRKCIIAIRNGTPLDDIRQEIEDIEISGRIDANTMFVRSASQVKNLALEIIDRNIGERGEHERMVES